MSLRDALQDPTKKSAIITDSAKLVDDEVASKGGLSGFAIKAGYAAVKGVKPGFIQDVLEKLLPEFSDKLDPLWEQGKAQGGGVRYFESNRAKIADALLEITDAKAKTSKSGMVRGTYERLRGSAKKNVEEAVPRLAKLMEKHA